MSEADINANAHEVADKIVGKHFGNQLGSGGLKNADDLPGNRPSESSCGG